MKRYIKSMAENKTSSFKSCVAQWVAYEVYRRSLQEFGNLVRVSDNKPGKALVLPSTHAHPGQNTLFQITPKTIDDVTIVVEQDNFSVTQDASTAVNTILTY